MESGAGYQVQTTSNWIEQDWWNLWSSQNRKRCRRPNIRCSKRHFLGKNMPRKDPVPVLIPFLPSPPNPSQGMLSLLPDSHFLQHLILRYFLTKSRLENDSRSDQIIEVPLTHQYSCPGIFNSNRWLDRLLKTFLQKSKKRN